MAKRIQKLTKEAPKFPRLANTDREDSEADDEEKETVMKKVPKSPGLAETDPENLGESDTEDTLRTMGFPIDKSLEVGKEEKKPVF